MVRWFVPTGQIKGSQTDVDRWRQRLALPPVLCDIHTLTHTWQPVFHRTITLRPLPAFTHTHTRTPCANYRHAQEMITVSHHTHIEPAMVRTGSTHSTTPPAQQMETSSVYEGHSSQLQHCEHGRQAETPSHIFWQIYFIFYFFCLFA